MTLNKIKKRLKNEEYIFASEKIINGYILHVAFRTNINSHNEIVKIFFKDKKEMNLFIKELKLK